MTQLNVVDTAKKLWSSKDEIAKNIWLAGLGAYGKSIDEAKSVSDKSSSLFEELVEKGTKIEQSAKEKLSEKKLSTDVLETRVNQVFSKISGVDGSKVDELNDKVDKLTKAISELKK
ncbi:MAG: poly(hydroxyalkanoate) granule-associated protein [Moritella sp.]|jgi:poly(hydroxyalkanoate) granule-associated protein